MISRSDSESSASPRLVEPFRSEKTIVTVLRTSCDGTAGASGVPQNPHRRKRSGFSSPQLGQVCTDRVYAARKLFLVAAKPLYGRVPEAPAAGSRVHGGR